MTSDLRLQLQTLHRQIGDILTACNRVLASIVVLGLLFCVMLAGTLYMVHEPERLLRVQGFSLNYAEFSSLNRKPAIAESSDSIQKPAHISRDSNWDGALAGAGIGLTVGRTIPVIGDVAGPIAGALIGSHLDSRI